jgi:hypothetical protein
VNGGVHLFFATRSLRTLTPAIQRPSGSHVPPKGQDAVDPGPASPSQPKLHTKPGPDAAPLAWPQCCPDGQSASVLQAGLTQLDEASLGQNVAHPASLGRQMQLNSMHCQYQCVVGFVSSLHVQLN